MYPCEGTDTHHYTSARVGSQLRAILAPRDSHRMLLFLTASCTAYTGHGWINVQFRPWYVVDCTGLGFLRGLWVLGRDGRAGRGRVADMYDVLNGLEVH